MTNREFYQTVATGTINEEVITKANELIAKMDAQNAARREKVSKKALENAPLVAKVVGYEGEILWDPSKPNGTPRKLLDVSKAAKLGWTYKTELEDGIRLTYKDFLENPMRAER